MKEIFRFWGYSRKVFHDFVGPDKSIQIESSKESQMKFGRLVFSHEALDLLQSFREEIETGFLSYLQVFSGTPVKGKVIVRLEDFETSESIPLVTIDDSGKFRCYFDMDQTIEFIQQEKYVKRKIPIYVKLGIDPDGLPGLVRKAAMLSFKASRSILRSKSRPVFPNSFKDFSVDVWRFFVKALVERLGDGKLNAEALWPNGKQFVVFLNHDVDTEWGFRNKNGVGAFRKIEEEKNLRSLWLIVTRLEHTEHRHIQNLFEGGHEIGCHGTQHDHRMAYLPEEKIRERLLTAKSFLRDFNCAGFRSPSYHHTETLFRALNSFVEYDMSVHDTFENVNSPFPTFEGCSTCFPFQIEGTGLFEFPTNVAEDFVLEMQGMPAERVLRFQLDMIQAIRKRGGVANLLTHPEPQLSGRAQWIQNYKALLYEITKDNSVWIPLPRELCKWWKTRKEKIDLSWQ